MALSCLTIYSRCITDSTFWWMLPLISFFIFDVPTTSLCFLSSSIGWRLRHVLLWNLQSWCTNVSMCLHIIPYRQAWWQMSSYVGDYIPACLHHWSSAVSSFCEQNVRMVGVVHSMCQRNNGRIRSLSTCWHISPGASVVTPWWRLPAWQLSMAHSGGCGMTSLASTDVVTNQAHIQMSRVSLDKYLSDLIRSFAELFQPPLLMAGTIFPSGLPLNSLGWLQILSEN